MYADIFTPKWQSMVCMFPESLGFCLSLRVHDGDSLHHFLSSNSIKRISLMVVGIMAPCLWWTHWLFYRQWSMHINVPGFFVLSVALRNLLMQFCSWQILCWIGLESDMYNVPFKNFFSRCCYRKVKSQRSILTRTFSSYFFWLVFIWFICISIYCILYFWWQVFLSVMTAWAGSSWS